MRAIRTLDPHEYDDFVTLTADAYPGMDLTGEAARQRFRERIEQAVAAGNVAPVGLFVDGRLQGVMRLYDFTMRLLSVEAPVGGVGGVAVGLLHKKEKIAFDMLQFFLRRYKARGAPLVALYPFRPDFYKQMGFGYGAPMVHYRVAPDALPAGPRDHLEWAARADRAALSACYGRYRAQTNGLFARSDFAWNSIFEQPALQIVAVKPRPEFISGYLIFQFIKGPRDNFLSNDLLARELVYTSPAALAELLAFLHSQRDQVARVLLNTQEPDFHFLLRDPRLADGDMLKRVLYHASGVQGVGIMYRVLDAARLFATLRDHDFNGQSLRLQISLADSFFPENAGRTGVVFENGRARLTDAADFDAAIHLDVSDFSSLVTGATRFRRLYAYGLATISDPAYAPVVDRLFAAPPPLCLTAF